MRRAFSRWLIVAVVFLVCVEISVRAAGLVDFPIYEISSDIKYIPKPNQSGAFLNTNDWYFNNLSMPIKRDFTPDLRPNILLIGNSIVMGGNPYKQNDKLTPQLQRLVGVEPAIWPAAAGGWTQVNEIAYLNKNPEIGRNADYVAWEYMAGGLSDPTPWPGNYVFPSSRPILASWYVFRRFLLPKLRFSQTATYEVPTTGPATKENIDKFDAAIGILQHDLKKPGLIWLYPTVPQLEIAKGGGEWLSERHDIETIAERHGMKILDIATAPEWNSSLYRDDGVHPTVEGNRILAAILAKRLVAR
jgi:hypothetical protein